MVRNQILDLRTAALAPARALPISTALRFVLDGEKRTVIETRPIRRLGSGSRAKQNVVCNEVTYRSVLLRWGHIPAAGVVAAQRQEGFAP